MRHPLANTPRPRWTARRMPLRAAALCFSLYAASPAATALAEAQDPGAPQGEEHAPFYLTPQFGAALINFVLLLLVLRRLGARPLSNLLVDRRRAMERSMAEASEMRGKAEALQKEYSERLAQLDAELAKLREDIARAAEEDKQRIVADAEDAARRLRQDTEALIDQHRKALNASVRRDVVEAASAAAEQILRSTLTDADQQRLAEAYRNRLAGNGSGSPKAATDRKSGAAAEDRP